MTETPPIAHAATPRGSSTLTRVAYALAFCVVLPVLLTAWARTMPLSLPAMHYPTLGAATSAAGLLMLLCGMWSIWRCSGGLPMNIAPPPKLVSTGIYGFCRHPIYVGFCLLAVGASVWTGSAAGLWVVSPMLVLGCFALVWGYERHDLIARFGDAYRQYRPMLSVPADGEGKPTLKDRLGIYLVVLLPWFVLYELLALLPPAPDALTTYLSFEDNWPVWQWTEFIYASTYLGVIAAPLLVRHRLDLRRFAIEGLWATFIGMLCFIVLPLTVTPRPFQPHGFAGQLLALERRMDPVIVNAFPSFHGFWALLVASVLSPRSRSWAVLSWTWAIAVVISCITTGMHGIADMLGAGGLFLLVRNLPSLYHYALHASERLANSYRYWRIGPVRIINHAIWSFAAGGIGVLLIGYLLGPSHVWAVCVVGLFTLSGAMLWAQLIEGSPRLLRPFGYYGAIVGGAIGCGVAHLLGTHSCLILAATAAAAPWIQAIGRFRCLVQGCCHGRPVERHRHGVRVTHPSSRVCVLAHLDGVPIHPTQLYSILANLVIGLLLVRIYLAGCSANVVTGLYLALAGLSRFVEESYRGEPQTRKWFGLPEYQWLAMLSLVVGCVLLALPSQFAVAGPQWFPHLPWTALAMGCVTALFMSVDLPDSHRRFARLTG